MTSSPGQRRWSRLRARRGVLQTTTDDDRRQRPLLVWPYTMCRRPVINDWLIDLLIDLFIDLFTYLFIDCGGGRSIEKGIVQRQGLYGAFNEHVWRSPGAGDLWRVPSLQDLPRVVPATQVSQLPTHVLRGLHRESRDRGVDVQEVHRLPRVHLSAVPQEDPAGSRWRQETSRQLPRRQPVRDRSSSAPAKVRHSGGEVGGVGDNPFLCLSLPTVLQVLYYLHDVFKNKITLAYKQRYKHICEV